MEIVKRNWRLWLAYASLFVSLVGPFAAAETRYVKNLEPNTISPYKSKTHFRDAYNQLKKEKSPLVAYGPAPEVKGQTEAMVSYEIQPYDGKNNVCYYYATLTMPGNPDESLKIGVCDPGYFITNQDGKKFYWLDRGEPSSMHNVTDWVPAKMQTPKGKGR